MDNGGAEPPSHRTRDWSSLIAKTNQSRDTKWGRIVFLALASVLIATFLLSAATAARLFSDDVDEACVNEVASWTYTDIDLATPPTNLVLVLDGGMYRAFDGYGTTGGSGAPPCMNRLYRTLDTRGLRLYASPSLSFVRVGVCHHPPCVRPVAPPVAPMSPMPPVVTNVSSG